MLQITVYKNLFVFAMLNTFTILFGFKIEQLKYMKKFNA